MVQSATGPHVEKRRFTQSVKAGRANLRQRCGARPARKISRRMC